MEEYRQRQTPRGDAGSVRPDAAFAGRQSPKAADSARQRPDEAHPREMRPDVAERARAIERQIARGNRAPQTPQGGGSRPGRPERPDRQERPEYPGRQSRQERQDRPERIDRQERPERPGRPEERRQPRGAGTQASRGRHYAAPRRKRRAFRMGGGLFFASAAVVILSLAWVITTLIELPARRAEAASLAAASAANAALASPQPGASIGPVPGAQTAYTPPSAGLLALPEAGRVDMRYFDDALFIGDSLTRGFQEYASGIPNAKYAAYIGVGPRQFMEGLVQNRSGEQVAAIDEILAAAPEKVYLLLGTNSMATLSDEAFLKYYEDFLDFLLPQLPADTVYYLQAIPPVTAGKMESDENFSVERIQGLNEQLALLAYRKGLYFLDLFSALSDETGALRADIASGEIHLNDSGYSLWREFLVTHTAYRKGNPYLPGSPYYSAGDV
ncbi:MAG: hypothetical protein HDT26_10860 [Subdoligranulum sp.]|nr:hypothetical protein [Subdoligranulum sp.]